MALWFTADTFKVEYRDIGEANDDAFIERVLQAAQDAIEGPGRGLNRVVLATSDSTKYLDATAPHVHSASLHVSDVGDLCSITSITNGDSTAVTSGQYTTYPRVLTQGEPTYNKITLFASSGVNWTYTTDPENAIQVTGKWGMWSSAASIPEALNLAVMQLAAFYMSSRDSATFDTVAIPDAGVITIPQGWPATVEQLIAGWRKL